jgi:hypothetical protein
MKTVTVTPREEDILRALNRYHYLTNDQLLRLNYITPTSESTVRSASAALWKKGLVGRFEKSFTGSGRSAYIYRLSDKGGRWIHSQRHRFKDLRGDPRHYLDVNDVWMALECLCRDPRVGVREAKTLYELNRAPTKVEVTGETQAVIPDAWFVLHISSLDKTFGCCVEVDRDSEQREVWQAKTRKLVAFIRGPYQEAFEQPAPPFILVVCPGNPEHARQLLRWTQAVLEKDGLQPYKRCFVFTAEDPVTADPAYFFLGDHWLRPFTEAPQPLLAGLVL